MSFGQLGRRKSRASLLFLTFLFNVPQPAAHPLEAQLPILRQQEFWVYRFEQRETGLTGSERTGRTYTGTYRQTVMGVAQFEGQDVYILRRDDGTSDILTLDLWELGRLDRAGNLVLKFGLKADPQFPLFVGRTYTREWHNTFVGYRGTFKYVVTGVENIRTPAGDFNAFRVSEQGEGKTEDGRPFTEWGTSYFAPAAKRFVRTALETNTNYRVFQELVSYRVER